jgi:hypothetical protein
MSETIIADMVETSRASMVRRWLLGHDDGIGPPNDLTFKEINLALDEIEARVEKCRKLYPWSPPKSDTEAILRSMPPHLRAGSKQDTAPVVRGEQAVETYRTLYGSDGKPGPTVDISA